MGKIDDIKVKACQTAINIANDDSHGYSQYNRNGPDYDCSSLVIHCYREAGLALYGATYTGNMASVFLKEGFKKVVSPLELGDVLLNEKNHTAIYIGNGKIVQATIAENGTVHGQTGDQTGKEIGIFDYYNYPWGMILRYSPETEKDIVSAIHYNLSAVGSCEVPYISIGDYGPAVSAIEGALSYHGFYPYGAARGTYNEQMETAVKNFQRVHKLEIDGIVGPITWNELFYWR